MNLLSCQLLTLVFFVLSVGEVLSLLLSFIIDWQDFRATIYLAPFPVSLECFSGSLTSTFVYSVLPCVYCHCEESHCYITYNNYFSKVSHGLFRHSLIYGSHIMGLRLTILDRLDIYILKSNAQK